MRPKSVIHGKDSDVIPVLLKIHAKNDPLILDCTYNKGVMWKGQHRNIKTLDIDPSFNTDYVGDFRNMHFISDDAFDVLAFDPPHMPISVASKNSSKIWQNEYGLTNDKGRGRDGDNISEMFVPFLKEAKRVLRTNGIILAKLSDIVHNHKYQWHHVDFINASRETGLTPCDLIIKIDPRGGNISSSKWKNIKHVRKSHCYWIVCRNGPCERR